MDVQDCSTLSSRTKFTTYISLLRNVTGGDFALVKDCKAEVCGAIWGSGNPDISGVGMATGYLLESVICALLMGTSMWLDGTARPCPALLASAARTFYDNAVFFTLAIQIASIFTLARVDFGIDADGMGGFTMEIAWLVSLLTLLPLLPMVLRAQMFTEEGNIAEDGSSLARERGDGVMDVRAQARQEQRLLFFVICWAMGFYPFFSRMGGTFGESRIGDTPSAAISTAEWSTIESVCFKGVDTMSSQEQNLITAFGLIGYLLLSIVVVFKIVLSAMDGENNRSWKWTAKLHLTSNENQFLGTRVEILVSVLVSTALFVHFWAFFRIRRLQRDMIEGIGESFPDEHWTFGQIVAVVVFLPVVAEVLYLWKRMFA